MYYAEIKNCDIANGPGVRVSLFVSGCTHHCKGCFNEVAWDFGYGKPFTQETINEILTMLKPSYIRGLTLLGGEPFEPQNQKDIVELLRQIKGTMPDKSIWAFSGYLFDRDILSGRLGDWDVTQEYLSYLDVLAYDAAGQLTAQSHGACHGAAGGLCGAGICPQRPCL